MARGGRRGGTPGAAYPNRTDLPATPRPLPVSTVPGQPYGAAGAQAAAQQAVPMAPGPVNTGAPAAPASAPPPPAPGPVAGTAPPLIRPTERPNEPVTAGAAVGPGPGPESLGLNTSPPPQVLGDLLTRLSTQNPDLAYLAAAAGGGFR